jgi:hypothetical protein
MRQTKVLWPILAIGVAMIVLPFAISLPSKASAGQRMMNSFHPIMQPAQVHETVAYYNRTFVPLRGVATGSVQAASELPGMIAALSKPLHTTPAGLEQLLSSKFPAMGGLLGNLPKIAPVFAQVPAGLAHYQPLVKTMAANVSNYAQIDSLPEFTLFTWFFVVPGVLLVLLAGWPLLAARRAAAPRVGAAVA